MAWLTIVLHFVLFLGFFHPIIFSYRSVFTSVFHLILGRPLFLHQWFASLPFLVLLPRLLCSPLYISFLFPPSFLCSFLSKNLSQHFPLQYYSLFCFIQRPCFTAMSLLALSLSYIVPNMRAILSLQTCMFSLNFPLSLYFQKHVFILFSRPFHVLSFQLTVHLFSLLPLLVTSISY